MNAFVTEAFTLLGLGTLVILLRTFARVRQVDAQHLQADDYLMLAVLAAYITAAVLVYIAGATYKGLANSSMTYTERAALDPITEEYSLRVAGSKLQVAGWCLYATLLWLVKASLCSFYLRLTAGLTGFEMQVKAGFVLLVVTYIVLICSILLSCQPINRFWQIYPDPGLICQPALSRVYLFMTLFLNLLTDLYLVLIPVPIIWKARLPIRKKLGLTFLFSGALFVMTAGALRCILTLKHPVTGPARGVMWAFRECFVAIVTSNLPMIWAWLRQKVRPRLGSQLQLGHPGAHNRIMLVDRDKGSMWHSRRNKSGNGAMGELLATSPTALTLFDCEDVDEGMLAPSPLKKVYVMGRWT